MAVSLSKLPKGEAHNGRSKMHEMQKTGRS